MARRNVEDTEIAVLSLLAGAGLAIATTTGMARAMCDKPTARAVGASVFAGAGGLIVGSMATVLLLASRDY